MIVHRHRMAKSHQALGDYRFVEHGRKLARRRMLSDDAMGETTQACGLKTGAAWVVKRSATDGGLSRW